MKFINSIGHLYRDVWRLALLSQIACMCMRVRCGGSARFPSRMTIGMLIESMAGKSAALHGTAHDATPFTFSEDKPAWEYFGEQLRAAGYDYYGTERMYSGITGTEFDADIFIGVC